MTHAPGSIATALKLIVNADDYGYSAERDAGIRLCCEQGIVRSVSLLVNGAHAAAGLEELVAALPDVSVGLHVNLTEGRPVCEPQSVASLLAPPERAFFRGKMGFREALDAGDIDLIAVAREVAAQLAAFQSMHPRRAAPSHFDGHQHIHTLAAIAPVLAETLGTAVHAVRIPELCAAVEGRYMDTLPPERRDFYAAIARQCPLARAVMQSRNIASPDAFVGYSIGGASCSTASAVSVFEALLEHLKADRSGEDGAVAATAPPVRWVEWMVHPGWCTPEPSTGECDGKLGGAAGCGQGPDDFSRDPGREVELAVMLDRSLHIWLLEHGVELGSYSDFAFAGNRR